MPQAGVVRRLGWQVMGSVIATRQPFFITRNQNWKKTGTLRGDVP